MNDFSLFPHFSSSLDYIGNKLPTKLSYVFQIQLKAGNKKEPSFTIPSCHMICFKCSSACFNCDYFLLPQLLFKEKLLTAVFKNYIIFPYGLKICILTLILFGLQLESHFIHLSLLLLAVIDRYRSIIQTQLQGWPMETEGWCWNPDSTNDWLWGLG